MNDKNIFEFDVGEFRPPNISRKTILLGFLALVVVIVAFSSFYQIQPEEVGVVLRFGRFDRTTEPGLNVKIPFVEDVLKVPVQRQLKQEFGFRTVEAGIRSRYSENQFLGESLMLTGDLNRPVSRLRPAQVPLQGAQCNRDVPEYE